MPIASGGAALAKPSRAWWKVGASPARRRRADGAAPVAAAAMVMMAAKMAAVASLARVGLATTADGGAGTATTGVVAADPGNGDGV